VTPKAFGDVVFVAESKEHPKPNMNEGEVEMFFITPPQPLLFAFQLENRMMVPLHNISGVFAFIEQHSRDTVLALLNVKSSLLKSLMKQGMAHQSIQFQILLRNGKTLIKRTVTTTSHQPGLAVSNSFIGNQKTSIYMNARID
jgi:hypothetical protein